MFPQLALVLTLSGAGFTEIDAFVEAQMSAHGIPGVALAIIEDGAVVHAKGFGPGITPQTPFLIGSLSKSFTAVAVMQQVEAGRLDLDAPVRRYLPWFTLADEQAAAALTVRQLLHHTSGLPAGTTGPKNETFTLEEHVRALAAVAPLEPAGKKHRYASANYLVLGLLVQEVAHEPFAAYVQHHVFDPLGMTASFTALDAARAHGLTPGHRLLAGMPVAADLAEEPGRLPTAALSASAADLARFLIAQMAGSEVLLKGASLAAMQAPGAEAGTFSYAMGWRVGTTADAPSLWHGGALPHYRGAMAFSPSDRWGVVVLSNLGAQAVDHTRGIAKGVTARLLGKPPPAPEQPLRIISALLFLAAAVPVGLTAWKLARLRRWKPKGSRRRMIATQALTIVLSALTALLLPRLLGLPLWAIAEAAPDLVVCVGLLLLLNSLLAALHLWALRTRRSAA